MRVKELIETLGHYEQDMHVVVAVVPTTGQMIITAEGRKLEVCDCWGDGHGVLNVIATTLCDAIDPALRSENDL